MATTFKRLGLSELLPRYVFAEGLYARRRVLELGAVASTRGESARFLLTRGARTVLACDLDLPAVEAANKAYATQGLRYRANVFDDLEGGSFDVLMVADLAPYVRAPELLRELTRLLSRGGILIGGLRNPSGLALSMVMEAEEGDPPPTWGQLLDALSTHFPSVEVATQSPVLGYQLAFERGDGLQVDGSLAEATEAAYFVAIAGQEAVRAVDPTWVQLPPEPLAFTGGKLEDAARRAREWQERTERMKELLERSKKDIGLREEDLKTSKEQLLGAREAVARLTVQLEEVAKKPKALEVQDELASRIRRLEAELGVARERAQDAEGRVHASRAESEAQGRAQKDAAVEAIAAQEIARLERSRREEIVSQLEDARTRLTAAYEQHGHLQDELANGRVELERTRLQADRVVETLSARDRELATAREREVKLAELRSEAVSAIEVLEGQLAAMRTRSGETLAQLERKEGERLSALRSIELEAQARQKFENELARTQSELTIALEEVAQLEAEKPGHETELQEAKAASNRLARDIEVLAGSERTWRGMAQELEQRLSNTQANVEALSEQVAAAEAGREAEAARYRRLEGDLTTAIGAERSAREQAEVALADTRQQVLSLDEESRTLVEARDALTEKFAGLESKRDALEATLANERARSTQRIDEVGGALVQAQAQIGALDRRIERLTAEAAEAQARVEALTAERDQQVADLRQVRAELVEEEARRTALEVDLGEFKALLAAAEEESNLRQRAVDEGAKQKASLEEMLRQGQTTLDGLREELRQKLEQAAADLARVQQEHVSVAEGSSAAIDRLREEQRVAIEASAAVLERLREDQRAADAAHAAELQAQIEAKRAVEAELQAQVEAKRALDIEHREQVEARRAIDAELQAQLEAKRIADDSHVVAVQAQLAAHAVELQAQSEAKRAADEAHAAELQATRDAQSAELAGLREAQTFSDQAHAAELQATRDAQLAELARLRETQTFADQAHAAELQATRDAQSAELARLRGAEASAQEAHAAELASLRELQASADEAHAAEKNAALAVLRDSQSAARDAHAAEIGRLREEQNAALEAQAGLREEQAAIAQAHAAELAKLRDEQADARVAQTAALEAAAEALQTARDERAAAEAAHVAELAHAREEQGATGEALQKYREEQTAAMQQLRSDAEALAAERQALIDDGKATTAELERLRAEQTAAAAALEQVRADHAAAATAQATELQLQMLARDELRTMLDIARSEVERTRAEQQTESAQKTTELTEIQTAREALQRDLEQLRAQLAEKNAEYASALEQLNEQKAHATKLEEKVVFADGEVAHLAAEVAEGVDARLAEQALREASQAERDASLERIAALEKDLQSANEGLNGAAAELAKYVALEEAIAQERAAAQKAIEDRKAEYQQQLAERETMAQRAAEEAAVAQRRALDEASAAQRQELEARDAAHRLELDNRSAEYQKSQADASEQQRAEADALKEQLDATKEDRDRWRGTVERAQSEARGHQSGKLGLQKELDKAREELAALRASSAIAGGESQAMAEARTQAEQELARLRAKLEAAEAELPKAQSRRDELEAEVPRLKLAKDEVDAELQKTLAARREAEDALTRTKDERRAVDDELARARDRSQALESELNAVRGSAQGSTSDLEAALGARRQAEELLLALRTKYGELQDNYQHVRTAASDLPRLKEEVVELRAESQMLEAERERLSNEVERLEKIQPAEPTYAPGNGDLAAELAMSQEAVVDRDARLEALMRRLQAQDLELAAMKKKAAPTSAIGRVALVKKAVTVPPKRPAEPAPAPRPSTPPIVPGVDLEVFELDIDEDQKDEELLDEMLILDEDEPLSPTKK